jgi:alkanesulfonate monooxygenase SsuD/methylene tetrahydromethanopterin reductase-like flavin-dependent oxidoreductase (luciferase family)
VEFGLQTRGSFDYLRRAARWAEAHGVVTLALPDHYVAGRSADGEGYDTSSSDIFPYLGALATQTESIELATLVSPITFRHPAHLLKLGLALDDITDGRFALGFGTGWMRSEHRIFGFPLPGWKERFDRLEEALQYVTAALAEGGEGFDGEYYSLAPGSQDPKPHNLRIILGGSGPSRSPNLAGRFADEFNIYSLPAPDLYRRIEVAYVAAEAGGRDPSRLMISSTGAPVIGSNHAEFQQRLQALADARGVDVEKLEKSSRDIAMPFGTHAEAAETFAETRAAGITRYYVQISDSMDFDYAAEVIEVLGNE